MKKLFALAVASVCLSIGSGATAQTTINFDDGTAGAVVGSTYAASGVTFTGTSFFNNFGLAGTSGGLAIASTNNGYEFGADTPLVGTFNNLVSSVTLRGIDVGQAGIRLEAYNASNVLVAFDQFFGSDVGVGTFHDLTVSGSGIAQFRAFQPLSANGSNAFGDGVLFDNLSFTGDAGGAVPEPASWALMILGMGAVGFAVRSRRKVSANVSYAG